MATTAAGELFFDAATKIRIGRGKRCHNDRSRRAILRCGNEKQNRTRNLVAATAAACEPFFTATTIVLHRFASLGLKSRIDAACIYLKKVDSQQHVTAETLTFSRFTPSFVHRFLISSLDLRIDASFSRFTPSFVHRFLNSSPDLGIDASFSRFKPSCVHRFLISSPDLGIAAGFCLFTPTCVQ